MPLTTKARNRHSAAPATPVASPEKLVTKPSRDAVVMAIVKETRATFDRADAFLAWLERIVAWSRANDYGTYYLRDREWANYHAILSTIAPDKAVAAPGSAHQKVESFLLDPANGEMGLLHDNRSPSRQPDFCTIDVRLSVVR